MKASLPAVAVLCSVMCFAGSGAGAQPVYRCGNTYSQSPCPAAVAVDVDDPRSAQQKQETDAASRRDSRAADAMEKSRLKQEAIERPAQLAAARAAQNALAHKSEKTPVTKKQVRKKDKDKGRGIVVFTDGKKKVAPAKGSKGSKSEGSSHQKAA